MTRSPERADPVLCRGLIAIVHHTSKTREAERMERALLESPRRGTFSVARYSGTADGDLNEQTQGALKDGAEILVVGGGDGTFLRILNRLGDSPPPILVAPLGTSNDYSRALGIRDLEGAVEALLGGRTRMVDLGRCFFQDPAGENRERVFASSAGVGLVAGLVRLEARPSIQAVRRLVGDLVYVPLSMTQTLLTKRAHMKLQVNGQGLEDRIVLMELGKVGDTGGLRMTPHATPDSGRFDVCIALANSRVTMLGYFLDLLRVRHLGRPDTLYFSESPELNRSGIGNVQSLRIETDPPLPLHLHGEFQGFTPATFTLLPGALRVFVPPDPPFE